MPQVSFVLLRLRHILIVVLIRCQGGSDMSEGKLEKAHTPILDKLSLGCSHQRNTFYAGNLPCKQCRIERLEIRISELERLNLAYGSAFEKQDIERQKQLHTINQLRQKLKSNKGNQ